MEYTLGEPNKEESELVTAELKAVLEKYDCEMQVTSTINILKRIYPDVVESPYNGHTAESKEESDEPAPESGSEGSGEEPAK